MHGARRTGPPAPAPGPQSWCASCLWPDQRPDHLAPRSPPEQQTPPGSQRGTVKIASGSSAGRQRLVPLAISVHKLGRPRSGSRPPTMRRPPRAASGANKTAELVARSGEQHRRGALRWLSVHVVAHRQAATAPDSRRTVTVSPDWRDPAFVAPSSPPCASRRQPADSGCGLVARSRRAARSRGRRCRGDSGCRAWDRCCLGRSWCNSRVHRSQ